MTGRLVLDVSSLARWTGPPVGIARVENALAAAVRQRHGAVLAFQDPRSGLLHRLDPRWEPVLAGFEGRVETWSLHSPRGIPSRYGAVMQLERGRLSARTALARTAAGAVQRALLAVRRHDFPAAGRDGKRIANVPLDMALGEPVPLGPGDVVLLAGNGWSHNDAERLAEDKARRGFRLAALCYDLLPLTHPGCFLDGDVPGFRAYWERIWRIADLVLFTARSVEAEARRLFADLAPAPATALATLGFDPPAAGLAAGMPPGLHPGRFALFVSTIEPRKGHAMLLRVWERLLARGVPQRHGFRLVFVGRAGWKVDAVLASLAAPGAYGGTVLHFQDLGDGAVDALYRSAAFCLYPSLSEGFGLPLIEAFARGRATLASSGGALPETAGALSPCLDPLDDAAWEAALVEWIERPEARAPWEAAIRARFAHPRWPDAAAAILDRVWEAR